MLRYFVIVVLGGWICGGAAAQPLVERVPADALVYVGWAGAEGLGGEYERSRLKALLGEVDREGLAEHVAESLRAIGEGDRGAMQAVQAVQRVMSIGARAWRYPVVCYVDMYTPRARGSQEPRFVLVIDAGEEVEASSLVKEIGALCAQAEVSFAGYLEAHGGLVVLSSAADAGFAAQPESAAGESIASVERFKRAVGRVGGDGVCVAYVDVRGVVDACERMAVAEMTPAAAEVWAARRAVLGLDGVLSAAWGGRFEGGDWVTRGFVDSPVPRGDVVRALLGAEAVTDQMLGMVPVDAQFFSAFRFDLGAVFTAVMGAVEQADGEAAGQARAGLEQASLMAGFDIERGLIHALGSQWVLYSDPGASGIGGGLVLVNRLADAERAEGALRALSRLLNQVVASQGQPGQPRFVFSEAQRGELTVHALVLPLLAPSWAVHDGMLFVGLYPQSVVMAHEQAAGGGASVLDAPAYRAMRARLGDEALMCVSFVDLPATAPQAYQMVLVLWHAIVSVNPRWESKAALAMLLPPLKKILPHVTPAGGAAWVDDQGLHTLGVKPFPGSTLLGPNGNMNASSTALVTGITLPALGAARRTARQMQSSTQVRGIHNACVTYAQGNKGRFPDDIGLLVVEGFFPVEYALSPMASVTVPGGFGDWPEGRQRRWVNEHASYVLLPGLVDDLDADKVAVFTRIQDSGGGGISVGFNDNHVELLQVPDARRLILAQTGKSLEYWSNKRPGRGGAPVAPR